MTLYTRWTEFCTELDRLSGHLTDFVSAKPTIASASDFAEKDECLLEGLLSRTWQAWCTFCRACVFESCIGTLDGNGIAIAAHAHATSDGHVSGAAIRAKRTPNPPTWGNVNTLLRSEPTWGDVDVLATIIPRLAPANQAQLLAAFSAAFRGAKALQLVRNATAHNNAQTIAGVRNMRSGYVVFPVTHPIQALFWTEPTSGELLILWAVEELRDAGLTAIS